MCLGTTGGRGEDPWDAVRRASPGERALVVTCQECSTSFQLDDARIPAAGARVRCSRCKHAFFVQNPSSSRSEAIASVVEATLDGESGRAPAPTRDLGTPASARKSAASVRPEPEEEDWQFSQEIRVADDDDRAEAAVAPANEPQPDSFDLTGDFGTGFDPETLSADAQARPAPVAAASSTASTAASSPTPAAKSAASAARPAPTSGPAAAPARDASSFGSIDDFTSLIDDDDEVSIDLASEPTTSRPSPKARHESATTASPAPAPRPATRPTVLARRAASSKPLDLFADGELPPVYEDVSEAPALARRLAPVGHALGACFTLVCVAFVAQLALRGEWARHAPAPQRLEAAPFIAESTRTVWLENSRSGLLLVIEGELRNGGSQAARPIPIELALLDAQGLPLADSSVRAGLVLEEEVLREAGPEALSSAHARAIAGFQATPLAPGEVRPFVAIARAEALPEASRRVLLTVGRPEQP